MRFDTDQVVLTMHAELASARVQIAQAGAKALKTGSDRFDLIDVETLSPTTFDGTQLDSFKPCAKRLKAYCRARKSGFRLALEASERSSDYIDHPLSSGGHGSRPQTRTTHFTTPSSPCARARH